MRITALIAATAACVLAGVAPRPAAPTSSKDVVLVTHDSFAISKTVKAAFEHETGLKLRILQTGDAGAALNRALLTAGKPEGDAFFGVDNNLLTRALAGNLLVPYSPPALTTLDRAYDLDPTHRLVPVDHSEVCVVYDRAWFARHGCCHRAPRRARQRRYAKLTVVENPATSTPGWPSCSPRSRASAAHGFAASGASCAAAGCSSRTAGRRRTRRGSPAPRAQGNASDRRLYSTDPAAEVFFAGKPLATAPVGVVPARASARSSSPASCVAPSNPGGAESSSTSCSRREFQAGMPLTMFVLPVAAGRAAARRSSRRFAPAITHPLQLPAKTIGANRDRWIREWTDIVVR